MDADEHPITDGIRRAIRDDGRTTFEISKLAGVSPQRIYRFLNGTRGLSLEVLDKLALLVGVEVRKVGQEAPPVESPLVDETVVPAPASLTRPGLRLRESSNPTAGTMRIPPPGRRGMFGLLGLPGTPVRRHPDGTPFTLDDHQKASADDYARRVNTGLARRAGQERRKTIQGLGHGVLDFDKGLRRLERTHFYDILDALLGVGREPSLETSRQRIAMRLLLKEKPQILDWIWGYPEKRRVVLARSLNQEDNPPEDEVAFREWAGWLGS